jgi:hypothetical protein
MIHLLWPTIRPTMMSATYHHWLANADNKNFRLLVAVNTQEQKDAIHIPGAEVLVSGNVKGVTYACKMLTDAVEAEDDDIIILASDDFYAPLHWDRWVKKVLAGKVAAVHVHDGYIKQDSMTIPIMTMSCLKRLNRIIYHTSYIHQYSDTELMHNLRELNLLIDKWDNSPVFEHKNWALKKREIDEHDAHYIKVGSQDANTWHTRSKLPIEERLC